jgi:hypothetical protein
VQTAHGGVIDGLPSRFDTTVFFRNAFTVIRVNDVEGISHLLAEAFLGLVAEDLFHGRVHEDDFTRFVDDLDRVTADLGDDPVELFTLAKRWVALLAV